jgi:hypothetical protein
MGLVVVLFVFGKIDARLSVLRSVLSECDFSRSLFAGDWCRVFALIVYNII